MAGDDEVLSNDEVFEVMHMVMRWSSDGRAAPSRMWKRDELWKGWIAMNCDELRTRWMERRKMNCERWTAKMKEWRSVENEFTQIEIACLSSSVACTGPLPLVGFLRDEQHFAGAGFASNFECVIAFETANLDFQFRFSIFIFQLELSSSTNQPHTDAWWTTADFQPLFTQINFPLKYAAN